MGDGGLECRGLIGSGGGDGGSGGYWRVGKGGGVDIWYDGDGLPTLISMLLVDRSIGLDELPDPERVDERGRLYGFFVRRRAGWEGVEELPEGAGWRGEVVLRAV